MTGANKLTISSCREVPLIFDLLAILTFLLILLVYCLVRKDLKDRSMVATWHQTQQIIFHHWWVSCFARMPSARLGVGNQSENHQDPQTPLGFFGQLSNL